MTKRIYGWRPDKPDMRDFKYSLSEQYYSYKALPPFVDLREKMPSIYDQGDLGSCTANAGGAAVEYLLPAENKFTPSRLFIYYNERVIEGTVNEDAGAEIRDCVKTLANQGACPETLWPYDIDNFVNKPSDEAYTEALKTVAVRYERLSHFNMHYIKAALADGYPVQFGFAVYESFESERVASTGKVRMPRSTEKMLGGHAVLIVGYDNAIRRVIVRNSWGTNWGMDGYYTMPYAYLTNYDLSDDFWIIRGLTSNVE